MLFLITVLFSVTGSFASSLPVQSNTNTGPLGVCPISSQDETELDCPWAAIARLIDQTKTDAEIESVLKIHAPFILKQLATDKSNSGLMSKWGSSRNADQSALTTATVNVRLLKFMSNKIGVTPFDSEFKYGPAGLIHTYGYLFSLVNTPYKYKRARYVDSELEKGFGLTPGSISGNPKSGTLLSNLTELGLRFAKKEKPSNGAIRIHESILNGQIIMQTDLVPFTHPAPGLKNVAALIYSVVQKNNNSGNDLKLITVFPIDEGSFRRYTPTENHTENFEVKLNFNGSLLPEISERTFKGTRTVVQ